MKKNWSSTMIVVTVVCLFTALVLGARGEQRKQKQNRARMFHHMKYCPRCRKEADAAN